MIKVDKTQTGEQIFSLVDREFARGNHVTLSFENIDSLSPAFINSCFVDLAFSWGLGYIRQNLRIVNCNKNIYELIQSYIKASPVRRFYLTDSPRYDKIYMYQ